MHRRDALRLIGLSALAPFGCRFPGAAGEAEPTTDADGLADIELLLRAMPGEVSLLPGASTGVWRFEGEVVRGRPGTLSAAGGSYLGPTIRFRRGDRVRVRFRNELSEPSIVHWHGLDLPESADGHPRFAVPSGGEYLYDFEVTDRAGTYWYHPHPHMRTGAQVYRGLAGLVVVEDDEEAALGLPSGASELLCVLQDRSFDAGNQFVYPELVGGGGPMGGRGGMGMGMGRGGGGGQGMAGMMAMESGFLGDRILANGQPDAVVRMPAGWARLRLLNGSNARMYRVGCADGRPFTVVGGDGGLLEAPLTRGAVALAPGQRIDLLLDLSDLSEGARLPILSLPFPAAEVGGMGMGMGMATSSIPQGAPLTLLTLEASGRGEPARPLPTRLSTFGEGWEAAPSAPVRRVALTMGQMVWTLGGRTFELEGVAPEETVPAGSVQVWELANVPNPMGMQHAHPIHLHGRHFRVLSRSGRQPGGALHSGIVDEGWRDTVLVLPGETVRIQIPFSEHRGLYLYHCHILEHEDMGMMRNFRIV